MRFVLSRLMPPQTIRQPTGFIIHHLSFLLIFLLCTFSHTFGQGYCKSTCTGNLGENIFPNGDFGAGTANILSGNPNLAPGYAYTTGAPPNDGFYTISNNTTPWGSFASNWVDIMDNGPETNGYMMVVNASFQPGLFYEKTVSVCENTLYELSIDIISLNNGLGPANPIHPDVAFEIDGQIVCGTSQIQHDASWHTHRFSFTTAPGVTSVKLSLRNNAPGGNGNDLAIDNISFRACGPEIDLPVTAVYCYDQSLSIHAELSNSPYNSIVYQWQVSSNSGQTWMDISGSSSDTYQVPQPNDTDQYRLVVANSPANLALSYCRAVSFPVTLMPEDLSAYAITGQDTIVCNGAPGTLRAGNFAAYLWSDGSKADTLLAGQPGWYAVTVTSANGCTASDSLYVYEVNLAADAVFSDPICFGDSTGQISAVGLQGGTGSLRFLLNNAPPQSSPFFTQLPAGTYQLVVADSLNCRVEIPVNLYYPPRYEVNLGPDITLFACDSVTLQAQPNYPPVHYIWQFSGTGLGCTTCPNPVVMPAASGVATLQVTDSLGCRATDSLLLTVLPRLDVYAPNVFRPDVTNDATNNYFTLFPSKSVTEIRRLSIYDRWGDLQFERKNQSPGASSLRWDGTNANGKAAAGGVYVWVAEILFSDGGVRVYKGDVLILW